MSSDNANMPAAETSPAVAAPETSPVVVASAAPVSAEKEGSHVVAKALPNTKALATSPGGEELNELYTGSIECDVFDPIKTSGQDAEQDEQAEAATESRSFKWLLAMGMVSFLLLAALSGTVYAAFQEDGALRYHCPSCPVGLDTHEMAAPPIIGSTKPEFTPTPAPEPTATPSELPAEIAQALPQLEALPDVEAVSTPTREAGEPPLVEVTFSIAYEAFAADEAAFRSRLIAEVAQAADVSSTRVQIEYVRAGSLTVGFAFLEIESEMHTPERGFGCMPAVIVNDFDAAVSATVSANMSVSDGFIPGAPADKPYFHDWFGDVTFKDFHHDDATNKGQVHATYTVPLPTAGCYVVDEWHLGGNQYCHGYMARQVPHTFDGCVGCSDGENVVHVDQAVNGGRWNAIGSFEFAGEAPVATVTVSNDDSGASDPAVQGVTDCTCEPSLLIYTFMISALHLDAAA